MFFFKGKAQFNVPFILLMIFIVSIIILGLMGGVQAITKMGIDNANADNVTKFALLLFPFFMVLFLVIFAIVMLKSAGLGGGNG